MKSPEKPSPLYIQKMFDKLARRYDLFNHLTSMGMAGLWRREALKAVKPGMRLLDMGCGTGDLALMAIKKVGPSGEVTGIDFSKSMLDLAAQRYAKTGMNGDHHIRFIEKRAEDLPFEEKLYDTVVSGFVLRNIYENIDSVLDGVKRSLKDGGSISFLDITEPESKAARFLWKVYMATAVEFYGRILFGADYPEFYLTKSAERFLRRGAFVEKLEKSGFKDVRAKSFMFGIITLYQAVKQS